LAEWVTVLTDTTLSSSRSAATGSGRRVGARTVALLALSIVTLSLTGIAAVAVSSPAHAATATSGGTPSPTANVAPGRPPTITVADSDSSRGTARGTATPGDSLRVLDPAHPASSLCTATADSSGAWSCSVTLTSGADQTLTVRDLTDADLPDVRSASFSVLTEPVVSTPSGIAVGASVSGTGLAGARVTATVTGTGPSSGSNTAVTALVSPSGTWSAILPAATVPTGTYSVSAVQRSSAVPAIPVSSASNAIDISIDRTAPAAPVLLRPANGSTVRAQPFTMSGTGETGARVTTYIDSNPVCTSIVRGGRWSCTTTGLDIPAGRRVVQAGQRDAAGNYGPASRAAAVIFTAGPTSAPSTPSSSSAGPSSPQSGPQSTAPGSGTTPGTGSGGTGGSGTGTPGAGGGSGTGGTGAGGTGAGGTGAGGAGTGGGTGGGSAGSAAGPSSLAAQAATSWTAPTGFGHDLPTVAQSISSWAWIWALILGVVFVLLVIVPMRLAATALGGRLAVRPHRLTGRNRAQTERDGLPLLPPAATVALTIVGGAVLVALSFGVDDQVRYLRLVSAIAVGLAAITGLGAVLPAAVLGRRFGLRLRLQASPRLLVVAGVACLVVRIVDVQPPIVLGVLLVATLVDGDGRTLDETGDVRRGGILATTQLGALALVSFVAWVAHGLIPAASPSFAVEMTREALATACLGGVGSLVVLLVPLGRLPGRALLSWSKPTLVGLGVVGAALAAVAYAGGTGDAFPVMPLVAAAVVFAVVAVSAWVWVRYVEPGLDLDGAP
jgi:hypothetical protein